MEESVKGVDQNTGKKDSDKEDGEVYALGCTSFGEKDVGNEARHQETGDQEGHDKEYVLQKSHPKSALEHFELFVALVWLTKHLRCVVADRTGGRGGEIVENVEDL